MSDEKKWCKATQSVMIGSKLHTPESPAFKVEDQQEFDALKEVGYIRAANGAEIKEAEKGQDAEPQAEQPVISGQKAVSGAPENKNKAR